jgi:hypothetical protein
MRLVRLPFLVAALMPFTLHAQSTVRRTIPEPVLFDTPWGDFPLERATPGARLRLTTLSGQRTIVRLAEISDSTVRVRSTSGDSLPSLTFAQLRALPRVEVRAIPLWRDRAGTYGLAAGALLGGITFGIARHNGWHQYYKNGKQSSVAENVAAGAGFGAFVGWMTGRLVIARPRWRSVTVP